MLSGRMTDVYNAFERMVSPVLADPTLPPMAGTRNRLTASTLNTSASWRLSNMYMVHAPQPQNDNSGKNGNAVCLFTLVYSAETPTTSPEEIGTGGHPTHDGAASGKTSGKKNGKISGKMVCVANTG